ncbi:radical SAM family heme chaperone HemW [Aquibacillus sp. 3ASR75-11]|uniref:Heme chaperone HemW n=1 Tax=Terrihalobacillus insolitus TaxID=2950438 RepID=A0A9X4ANV9_9BACI|nr:radical SAM family heme chaperone HemW [Terrihalobacillus insolitus]MDC3413332.1 radical SAM family heme chaperone HemW [Terrihalobacillus insolitus]MDC3424915.1 radical SAM family heme chaperone HemW [Terrihalobacillus insolitus]
MVSSVYIHIPFCQQICHYCDFTKFFYNEQLANQYLEALEKEISTYIAHPKEAVRTIFVGGGTPTALTSTQLKRLLDMIDMHFEVTNCLEYTFEANPGDLDEEKIHLLKSYGVNRISLGVQVFDDNMLEEIGRIHRVKDVYRTIESLLKNDFGNTSIDLIYGLPNQTLDHFKDTLQEAMSFGLPHYSAYSLQIEPKTVFYQRYKKGKLHKPKEEEEAAMFEHLRKEMEKSGVHQYEISNFSKSGFESKHNLTYWNNDFYYGFGAGAHGYLPGRRIINLRPLPAYVKQANENGIPVLHEESIGKKEKIEEEMFLGLRKMEGVSKTAFFEKYGTTIEQLYGSELHVLKSKGWLADNNSHIHLTKEGVLFGNGVFQEFLLDDKTFAQIN